MKVLVAVEDALFGSAIATFVGHHQWPQGTEFRVVNVVEPYDIQSSNAGYVAHIQSAADRLLQSASAIVDDVAALIQCSASKATVLPQVIEGSPADELLAIARDWPADMIVAGSHGRRGFSRLFVGSTSLKISSEAPCSVILVKPDAMTLKLWESLDQRLSSKKVFEQSLAQIYKDQTPKKIIIAVDETPLSRDLVNFVKKHDWVEPVEFKVLRVYKTPSYLLFLSPSELQEINQDAIHEQNASLRKTALGLRAFFHSPRIEEQLVEGDPKSAIVQVAKEWEADLIMVGSHFEPIRKALLGSVSLSVLCNAPCSVLVVRQSKPAVAVKEPHSTGVVVV